MSNAGIPRACLRTLTVALAAAAASLSLAVIGLPAHADPSIGQIEQQLEQHSNDLGVVVEQYNSTKVLIQKNQAAIGELQKKIKPLQVVVDAAYARVGALAARAYRGGYGEKVNVLLSGGSADSLLEQMSTMDMISRNEKQAVAALQTVKKPLDAETARLNGIVTTQQRAEANLVAKKTQIEQGIANLKTQWDRAARNSGRAACPPEYVPGKAGKVVNFVCAQQGKPYIWASSGPNGFDCSGLIVGAYRTIGISLYHGSRDQIAGAKKITRAELQPGDIITFYADNHHIGMYVGKGKVVHSPTFGDVVKLVNIDDAGPVAQFGRLL